MIKTGKTSGRFLIGSGKGVNPGRLAAGAPGVDDYKGHVFGLRSVFSNPLHGNRPGGLIDKQQQIDPASTTFGHPFDGGGYRSISTLPMDKARTGANVTQLFNPLKRVPEIAPHERGTFFRKKVVPIVKTQFGAAKSGLQSDTAFHPQVKRVEARQDVKSSYSSEKIQRTDRPPSFETRGNLWASGNHSFIAGKPNTITGDVGKGRWNTTKRSVI